METLLAIHIGDSAVDGLVLEQGDRTTVVRAVSTITIDDGGLVEAVQVLLEQLDVEPAGCRLSLSADRFFFRNMTLPFADRGKIEKILPLELEENTTFPYGKNHLDFLFSPAISGGAEVLTAMIQRELLAELLFVLKGYGMDPELVTVAGLPLAADIIARPDVPLSFMLLDIDEKRTTLILVKEREVVLIRSLPVAAGSGTAGTLTETVGLFTDNLVKLLNWTVRAFGRSPFVEREGEEGDACPCYVSGPRDVAEPVVGQLKEKLELPVLLYDAGERPFFKIEVEEDAPPVDTGTNSALALGLVSIKDRNILNFRRGEFKKRQSLKQVRRLTMGAVLPLAALCLGILIYGVVEIRQLNGERDRLKGQVEAVFRETLPETKVVRPVEQMRVKVDETRKMYRTGGQGGDGKKKVDIIAELSSRIPANLPIRLTRFVADQDDILLKGETEDFNTVDSVQKELEKSSYFSSVVISSANLAPKGDGVRFELKLEFADK